MQTNDLLATGGMLQEGGTKDPVSGNDVPAGALKEEVRDSVDAKLSVGEFVFPADVTRYIGLDKLMQIRDAAKQGLQEMDSKGQMGNAEEVAADDSGNEDKFSSHIDEIISGLDKGEPKKFATGGSVNADYSGAPIKGFKMVQYVDDQTKTVKYIPFINGKPLLPIPKGYTEKKETVTPPTTPPPVIEQPVSPVAGGSGSSSGGGKSTDGGDGSGGTGGAVKTVNDAGVEGFGDIQGGTSRNVGRALGFAAGVVNPIFGLLVSAASQYSIKVNNEKLAAANAAAIDSSALTAAGFNSADVERAKEAATKATLEGKSAKEIAVAAANAAGTNTKDTGINTSKTTLDALVGITNGFGTANKDVMAMPKELVDKIPEALFHQVLNEVAAGVPAQQAVDKAVNSVEGKISLAGLDGQVPAGEFDTVAGYINAGMTPQQAIDRVVTAQTDADIAKQDAKEAADKAARDKETKDEADRVAKEAATQAAIDAANKAEAADKAAREKEAADKEAAQRAATEAAAAREQADKVARDEQDRAAEKAAQERAAKEQADREQAAREQADREQAARDAVDRASSQERARAQTEANAAAAANAGFVQAPGEAGRGGSNQNTSPMGANAAPPGGPPSGEGGGGGGGGGGRVICTHFYRKGEMSRDMWRSDLEFTFKHLSPTTVRGYQYWAIPYVKLMRKSKLAENIMRPLAMHRAQELSYQMGRSPKGSLFGKVVRLIGEPICFTVGLFVGEQNWESLWESNNKTTYNINI